MQIEYLVVWFHYMNIHINVECIMPLYFKYTYEFKRDHMFWKDPGCQITWGLA